MLSVALAVVALLVGTQPPAAAAGRSALPARLRSLEQKMQALQITSERYTQTYRERGAIDVDGHVTPTLVDRRELGEVSLAPAQAEVLEEPSGAPREIEIGSSDYTVSWELAALDGGRPWTRFEHANIDAQFPFHGGSVPSGEVDDGGSGPYAELFNLITTARGPVQTLGSKQVEGQQTRGFELSVEPLALIKGLTPHELHVLDLRTKRERLEVFFAEDGVPLRVVTSVARVAGRSTFVTTIATEIGASGISLTLAAPPAPETIGEQEAGQIEAEHQHRS